MPNSREQTPQPPAVVPKNAAENGTRKGAPAAIIASPRFSKVWATLAFNALNTTNASGATIFLREGSHFACVARFGKAPAVGTTMRVRGGLFADCIDARQLVVCHENAASKLHDLPYKQRPSCASAALIPFELDGRVEGVLAVFSTFPSAFRQTAWDKLSAIAMVIESVLFSVSFAKNAQKFGSSAATVEQPAIDAPLDEISPPASYDSDQDFLRHMSSMLPAAARSDQTSAHEAQVDPIDAILAKVCGDLDLISGRASRAQARGVLDSALAPEAGASAVAFNFDDELRAAEMQGQKAPDSIVPSARQDVHNEKVTIPKPFESHAPAGFDLSSLATPESAESGVRPVDDAQAAIDELMRQAGSHVDNEVANGYLSQLGDLFSLPQSPAASPEPATNPDPMQQLPQAEPMPEQTQLPEPILNVLRTAIPDPPPRPPIADLPTPAEEDEDLEARYSLSPRAIALIVALVVLIVIGVLLWSH